MVAGCGAKCAKMFLFLLNFCVWLIGIGLIGGGSYLMVKINDYSDLFAEDDIRIVGGVAIGVGCFAFLVGFCGCCGAIKESKCLLGLYFVFMLLIILAQFVGGILGFVYSDDIKSSMLRGMTDTIENDYGNAEGSTNVVNDWQKAFDCCGATNYSDYENAQYFTGGSVPESCCKTGVNVTACTAGPKGKPVDPKLVWSEGCVDASYEEVKDHYVIIAAAAIGLILFEVLAMVFACCVIKGLDEDYDKFA
ncbi:CD63 antigen-like [Diadema antillarum]|uniref:CD63 antigen-like n=1 Tax=Diadema antillarum TaxID=105358 RepID=UPI003A861B99